MISGQTTQRLVGFVRHLRQQGFIIGFQEVLDLMSSVDDRVLADINHSRNVMRSLTCHSRQEWRRFDDLFLEYWKYAEPDPDSEPLDQGNVRGGSSPGNTGFSGSAGEAPDLMHVDELKGSGAGKQSTISKADFRFLKDRRAMREVEILTEQLAQLLNKRLRRRMVIRPSGRRIAIRPTLRRNLSYGGLPVHMYYHSRQREPLHLVILHDVSHSMAWNNPLLFRFVRGLVRAFKTSEVFTFHTELFRATPLYRERSLTVMQRQLEARNHLWMGGTCIAESVHQFNRVFAPKFLTSRSVVMILSDGFDTDSPEDLARELMLMKKKARKLIWLNPMIGREGYDSDQPSMRPAKPYIDFMASANNLDALRQTTRFIAQACR